MIGMILVVNKFAGNVVEAVTGQPDHRHAQISITNGYITARVRCESFHIYQVVQSLKSVAMAV